MLLDRLENDRSLSAFAGQFVPVKMVTDGNPQWSNWARKYPIDGDGIPRLYVIRADGEMLYGAVGSLPGDELPRMLTAALKQSGRALNPGDAQILNDAVAGCEAALERGDRFQAAIALSAVNRLGSPENLGSYATAAMRAGELFGEIESQIEAQIEKARERFNASDNDAEDAKGVLAAALVLAEAEAAFKLFPKWRRKSSGVSREIRKNKSYEDVFAQADALVRARGLAAAPNPRMRGRAVSSYIDVIRRFPDTEADQLARAELKAIDPDATIPELDTRDENATSEPALRPLRQWNARSGNYRTTARYIQQSGGKVQLMKPDGSKIWVEIAILSDEDQAFLREQ